MDAGHPESLKKNSGGILWILILLMAAVLVVFTLQNQALVSIKIFFWTIRDIPIPLLIVLCLLLGYLIPYVSLISRIWKLKRELKLTRKENEELQSEHQEKEPSPKVKPDPEGIAFGDDDTVSPRRKNVSDRFFRE